MDRLLGWNDGTGQIVIAHLAFTSDVGLWKTVYHEIGHNFDDPTENGFINDFRKISKWTPVGSRTSFPGIVPSYRISLDGEWEYTDVDTEFTRTDCYSQTNPLEDYATTWEFYFMERYHNDISNWNFGLRDVSAKHQNVDQFFASLS